MHYRDLGEFGCPVPAVDRQGQRPAHPHIIEGLFLVVGFHQGAAIPVVGLHSDLVAKRLEKLVAGGRRKPAEFDRRAVTADRLDRKSTRLNSSHLGISYAVFCLKKKNTKQRTY